MARAYSADLRERVVASVEAGRSCRTTASLFGVSVASVVKWSQRKRLTGSAAAKRIGGSRRRVLCGSERDWLLARIAAVPDVTLRGLLSELAARGVKVSYGSVWRFFEFEGISFKKNRARERAGQTRRGAPPGPLAPQSRRENHRSHLATNR